MNRIIALLRGINVGGRNKTKMKELSALLASLGYENVRTYIQSGNVVFDSQQPLNSAEAAQQISDSILQEKGFAPSVLLLEAAALREAIRQNPFPTIDGKRLHFYFLQEPAQQPDLAKLAALQTATEQFVLTDTVFYLHAPDGIGRSKLAAAVEKALGVPATARNWNTVQKLAQMIEEA